MLETLYHYTSTYHLPQIMRMKFLKLVDSNLLMHPSKENQVVWLTSTLNTKKNRLGLIGSMVDKQEIRFHIPAKPDFVHWNNFKKQHKHDKSWVKALEKNNGSTTWWVSPRTIPLSEVYKIENVYTGEVYYLNPALEKVGK